MLTKDQEKILRWLLSLKTDIQNTITISNSMTEYPNGYTDKQIIKKLNEFENLGFITIKWYSPNHNNLNYAVDVTVLKDSINYFADKKKNRTSNKRDWIKTYIPITISFIALLKSFDTEIIWLWKQLMQLLK
jgi:hypothetical protein|nr:MAG TPA: hypothetical protein [Caudoviricetes sp.]